MKQYKLVHLSYDYLARNKVLMTGYSRYTFIHEYWDKIGRCILATRKDFGTGKDELVEVVIRYD